MSTSLIHLLAIIAVIILLCGAVALRLYVKRKRFYRRSYGHECFNSFKHSVLISMGENLLLFLATLFTVTALIITGLLFL